MNPRWEIPPTNTETVAGIMTEHGVSRPIALSLAHRNFSGSEIKSFLKPRLKDLIDPYSIKAIRTAANRLWRAIREEESILIYGDYDTDGITSTALLSWVLQTAGARSDCFLPNRIDDGYGLTPDTVAKSINDHKVLITVDCGITSYEAIDSANKRGVDVIVTDHHQPGEKLPDALAIINPKIHGDSEELHSLAGVGVCFKLCHGFIKYGREHSYIDGTFDLKEGLDLVALGTVADIVPLVGENRCLVKHGMQILKAQRRPGLRALCDVAGIKESLATSDISFRLAPRINAAGRLGDAGEALRLLQSSCVVDAYPIAKTLDGYNQKRRQFEGRIFEIARKQIKEKKLVERHAIVIAEKDLHQGVVGIVAARIAKDYHRPALVMSILQDGQVLGSGRSIPGIDLVKLLNRCSASLTRYGGHSMAVGLSLDVKNLEEFCSSFEAAIQDICKSGVDLSPSLELDGDVRFSEMDQQFSSELEALQPFGHGNKPPAYCFCKTQSDRLILAGERHTRGTIYDEGGDEMPFIAFGRKPEEFPAGPWDVAGVPQHNFYNGRKSLQLQILDVKRAS